MRETVHGCVRSVGVHIGIRGRESLERVRGGRGSEMECPNGCDPEFMEYESAGGSEPSDYLRVPGLSTEYRCGECDWLAIWEKGQPGLNVKFPGVGRLDYRGSH